MTTQHRFVGPHNGIPVAFALVVLVFAIGSAFVGGLVTMSGLGLAAAIVLALMSPLLVWVVFHQLQDIISYDSATKTLRVLRRRALMPDAVYEYIGSDVRSVSITRVTGEACDSYFASVRMADRRQFRFTREQQDAKDVADDARALLSALGRSDDVPILYYGNRWHTEPTPFTEELVARPASS